MNAVDAEGFCEPLARSLDELDGARAASTTRAGPLLTGELSGDSAPGSGSSRTSACSLTLGLDPRHSTWQVLTGYPRGPMTEAKPTKTSNCRRTSRRGPRTDHAEGRLQAAQHVLRRLHEEHLEGRDVHPHDDKPLDDRHRVRLRASPAPEPETPWREGSPRSPRADRRGEVGRPRGRRARRENPAGMGIQFVFTR